MATWAEPDVDVTVLISTAGPFDDPGAATTFDVTDWVRGGELTISRGRSTELDTFGAGACTFELRNNGREFDPALAGVALDLPGVAGATASTPDHSSLAVTDLDARMCLSMDNWVPGGFGQWLIGQYPNVAGNNGWVVTVSPTGFLSLSWSTNGTNLLTRTATARIPAAAGATQCLGATLDVDNGAGQHVVTFWVSADDGRTWAQLGAPVTTAGTTSVFNGTAPLAIGDVLPLAGQARWAEVRTTIGGPPVAAPDFTSLEPGTTSFTDSAGRPWAVNGAASIGYDDDASPFAPILRPLRRVQVVASRNGAAHTIYVGYLAGWVNEWAKTTGTAPVVAHDLTTVLANVEIGDLGFRLDHDHLDVDRLGGDVSEQLTGERVETLVSMAGFEATQFRVIQPGQALMPATEARGSLLAAIQAAEQAEAGFFFIDRNGVITFLDRHSRIDLARMATNQATLTDGEYAGMATELDLTQVWNDVTRSRPGGTPQAFQDEESMAAYGHRVSSEEVEVVSDGEAYARAEFFISRYSRPRIRPMPVTVKPARRNKATLWDKVVPRDVLDRITIERTPFGVGPATKFVGLVEQLAHRITKDDWATTIAVSLADIDDVGDYFTLDDPVLSALDAFPLVY